VTRLGQNEMKPKRGMPWRVRLSEWLGFICVCKDGVNSVPKHGERVVSVEASRKKLCTYGRVIVCKLFVLLPCALVAESALAFNERLVLLNSRSVRNETVSQNTSDIWFVGVSVIVPGSGLNGSQGNSERGSQLACGGATGVAVVDVQQQHATEDCGEKGGDGWGVWWQWVLAGVLPLLMFLADAALRRVDET
jgi:hypothetical protein